MQHVSDLLLFFSFFKKMEMDFCIFGGTHGNNWRPQHCLLPFRAQVYYLFWTPEPSTEMFGHPSASTSRGDMFPLITFYDVIIH